LTVLYETITDQAVAERLRACGPWVPALLRRMLPLAQGDPLPAGRRFVVIDASSKQAPGATGTDQRLHIALDLWSLQFLEVLVSDVHTGEPLKHWTLAPGDVAVADRGYAQCQGMQAAVAQGEGFPAAGSANAASYAEGAAQHVIARREQWGDQVLAAFLTTNAQLHDRLTSLGPQDEEVVLDDGASGGGQRRERLYRDGSSLGPGSTGVERRCASNSGQWQHSVCISSTHKRRGQR
jgi:hypothetical protein